MIFMNSITEPGQPWRQPSKVAVFVDFLAELLAETDD
jgi:hypothetical protein